VRFRLRYAAVGRAQRVIVPTRAVAEDAIEHLGIPEDRVIVISEAPVAAMHARPAAEVAAVRLRYDLPAQDYLLWVGGLEHPDPRKRVAALADAPRDLPLVLVGRARPWAQELGERDGITVTGHVTDDELAALYTGARALVFPSDDEGFGLPTVEALACGTPVVACDVPALREVLGDRATFVDRRDLAGLLSAGAAATRPAPPPPDFTWEDAARATWGTPGGGGGGGCGGGGGGGGGAGSRTAGGDVPATRSDAHRRSSVHITGLGGPGARRSRRRLRRSRRTAP
jgi:alpha-1,3-rhamnosyl/mannosyltransferase